jgi:hypothetical protein
LLSFAGFRAFDWFCFGASGLWYLRIAKKSGYFLIVLVLEYIGGRGEGGICLLRFLRFLL